MTKQLALLCTCDSRHDIEDALDYCRKVLDARPVDPPVTIQTIRRIMSLLGEKQDERIRWNEKT